MIAISPRDASLLALLAERPDRNSSVTREAYSNLGPDAQKVADALRGDPPASDEAAETAEGLHEWVKTNRVGVKRKKRK